MLGWVDAHGVCLVGVDLLSHRQERAVPHGHLPPLRCHLRSSAASPKSATRASSARDSRPVRPHSVPFHSRTGALLRHGWKRPSLRTAAAAIATPGKPEPLRLAVRRGRGRCLLNHRCPGVEEADLLDITAMGGRDPPLEVSAWAQASQAVVCQLLGLLFPFHLGMAIRGLSPLRELGSQGLLCGLLRDASLIGSRFGGDQRLPLGAVGGATGLVRLELLSVRLLFLGSRRVPLCGAHPVGRDRPGTSARSDRVPKAHKRSALPTPPRPASGATQSSPTRTDTSKMDGRQSHRGLACRRQVRDLRSACREAAPRRPQLGRQGVRADTGWREQVARSPTPHTSAYMLTPHRVVTPPCRKANMNRPQAVGPPAPVGCAGALVGSQSFGCPSTT